MTSRAKLFVFPLLVAGLPFAAACESARGTSERVAEVEAKLSEELGTKVKVHCPTMIDQTYYYCTAEVPGHEGLAFPVRVKSRGADVEYTTKRWVTGARMVELGKHHLKEKLGIEVESMKCPMISHMPDGAKALCDAKAEGIDLKVEVGMVIKVSKLSFEPVDGVVLGSRAAEMAHEKLHDDKDVYADVKCSQSVIVSVPGKRFECEATMPDKTVSPIHFLITSKDGKLAIGAEPPPEGSKGIDSKVENAKGDGAKSGDAEGGGDEGDEKKGESDAPADPKP